MDPLSTSVSSTLNFSSLPSTNRDFYYFTRTPYATPTRPPQPQPHVSSTSNIHSFTPKIKALSHSKCSSSLASSSSNTPPLKIKPSAAPIFHRNPATGYAAAFIDVAQSSNSLHSVQKDVQRLLKLFQTVNFESSTVADPSVVEEVRGQVVKKVVERGNFHRHVVCMLKMLLKKNKLGIVQQVLEEFERIYDELCGTQVVLVSSEKKMGEDELLGIAKSVQQLSGAVRVKVKNLVPQNLPSFAV